jgi:nucleoside-diphosphate-sugar epimerase
MECGYLCDHKKHPMTQKFLVLGASGQIGSDLVMELRSRYGGDAVIATDVKVAHRDVMTSGPFYHLNAMDLAELRAMVEVHQITDVFHLVAMLSATAEKFPEKGWELNMVTLFNVLNLAKEGLIKKIFWPSSIAVFGPNTPKNHTPQETIMEPNTVYGISKLAGERWCAYYHEKYGVDVRSIRYPGLISYKAEPGGGTTDYAIHIFHEALKHLSYTSFLSAGTYLPMMYMPDAIRATLQLMDAPAERIKVRSSYNLGGVSFSPVEIANEIKKHLPEFEIRYAPDWRQQIADSWPASIVDDAATRDWDWQPEWTLEKMTTDMLHHLKSRYPS